MAASSFDRRFTVQAPKAAEILLETLENGQSVTIKRRDIEAESKRGAKRLARQLRMDKKAKSH